jgi:GNAT superfamily N-acetyltransferase
VPDFALRRADLVDMPAIARLHRHARETCLPYLPDLHTPAEDLAFFQGHVLGSCTIWLAEAEERPVGFAAVRPGWLDHLYVDPAWHGRGVGQALLSVAKEGQSELNLLTFQRNVQARRFYERQGFALVALADGSANEEREPDAHYRWMGDRSR